MDPKQIGKVDGEIMEQFRKKNNMTQDFEKRLEKFLDERCYEIGSPDDWRVMRDMYPDFEGRWGVEKASLKAFISSEIEKARKEVIEEVTLWGYEEDISTPVFERLKIFLLTLPDKLDTIMK